MSRWTFPSTAAKEPGATGPGVQRWDEVRGFITGGESNFLSIDSKWWWGLEGIHALLLSDSIQLGKEESRLWVNIQTL